MLFHLSRRPITLLLVLIGMCVAMVGFLTWQPALPGRVRAATLVIYVWQDANGANNGTTWEDAYTDLQNALTAAQNGDEIWVAAGAYTPTDGIDRTATFQLKNGVELYGGFAGVESARNERNPTANPTVLSGDLLNNDGDNIRPDDVTRQDNSYRVLTAVDIGHDTIIDGFTVTGGNANEYPVNSGGALYNERSHLTLRNLTIVSNTAIYMGGAIFNVRSSPTIIGTHIRANYAGQDGGAIANLTQSGPYISHSTIEENVAVRNGGGVFADGGHLVIADSTLRSNSALENGGSIFAKYGETTLHGVTLSGSSARRNGGAIYVVDNPITVVASRLLHNLSGDRDGGYGGALYGERSQTHLTSTIVLGNSACGSYALHLGGGQHFIQNVTVVYNTQNHWSCVSSAVYADAHVTVVNSILWQNFHSQIGIANGEPYTVSHSLVQGGFSGEGNIDIDPIFVNGSDLRLQVNSPAIDAGSNEMCAESDIAGLVRPWDGDFDGTATCDMGAHEFGAASAPSTATPTVTSTPPPLPSPANSATPTPTETQHPTSTPTESPSGMATPTATGTGSPSPTGSPTATGTPVATSTPTNTPQRAYLPFVGYPPTSTPTATATATATQPPPATATPLPPVLHNGGFEEGPNSGWTTISLYGLQIILPREDLPLSPYQGNWAAWLGGAPEELSILYQKVTVPQQDPVLRFHYVIASADVCGYDFAGVFVNGDVVDAQNLCSSANSSRWNQRSVNLGSFAGQTIELEIVTVTDDTLNSNYFVDNVTLGVQATTGSTVMELEVGNVQVMKPEALAASSEHPPSIPHRDSAWFIQQLELVAAPHVWGAK